MEISVDIEDAAPLFAQLIDQIKRAVQTGQVAPGDPLPSIRQLAIDLELNNKTVAKAYRLLERDSIIQTRGYRGSFVHPDAKTNSTVDLSEWVSQRLVEAIDAFRDAGVTDSEIRIAFTSAMNEQRKQGGS